MNQAIADKINSRYIVDLKEIGEQIELVLADYLKPPPVGIYTGLRLEPVMTNGNKYYTKSGTEESFSKTSPINVGGIEKVQKTKMKSVSFIEIEDINKISNAVYSANGTCIISSNMMQNKERFISNKPLLPYRGIKIARILYENAIESSIAWRKYRSNHFDKIASQHLSDNFKDSIEEVLDNISTSVSDDLSPLLINNEWKLFHIVQKEQRLDIERGEDYRIIDWMKRLSEGEIKL